MHSKKLIAVTAFFIMSIANAAHADVFVFAYVDNQTSSSVTLGGSSTTGTFQGITPLGSVAANTRTVPAVTFTVGTIENGGITYGACSLSWNVNTSPTLTVSTGATGLGNCTASQLPGFTIGTTEYVIVELDIT